MRASILDHSRLMWWRWYKATTCAEEMLRAGIVEAHGIFSYI
uniref:Uncharacterized protein n=1 Tax=Arundo donax TaxID=35708 RepID=A0A0A8ZNI3_ARUDO